MTEVHKAAMSAVYRQLLDKLRRCLTRAQRAALQLLMQRLVVAAGGPAALSCFRVLVVCNGSKDSLQALLFLRTAQLCLAQTQPGTFTLRVATWRHPGLSPVALGNLERTCQTLFVDDDPRVQRLMVDDQQVQRFDLQQMPGEDHLARHRLNMLMSGHLTGGDERVTFGNSGYLSMADYYTRAMAWGGGVDAVAIADPPREVRHYLAWGLRAAQGLGAEALPVDEAEPWQWQDAFTALNDAYHRYLQSMAAPVRKAQALAPVQFVATHGLLDGDNPDNWQLLVDVVGFEFMGQGSGLGEFDCVTPLLLAHMQGLRSQWLTDRGYRTGVHDYLRVAVPLMRSKGMPESLVRRNLAAWSGQHDLAAQRALANHQVNQAYDVEEAHLVCLLFTPFVDHGVGLRAYVQRCHPAMEVALPALHSTLQGYDYQSSPQAREWLMRISGLPLVALQRLYHLKRIDLAGLGGKPLVCEAAQVLGQALVPLTGRAVADLVAGRP